VSWQLAAFSILAFALIAGFAWYERTRPDARIVALVATLAALAALGRIAFAAVPNVKPTTDIVLISGYTLGGAPGFAVGAIAGLTSNFFFGQGPWTPWQMAAWGLTGIIGAGLAVITRRRIGRWPLAIVCGVAGFWFAAFQDFGDWVTFSDHSLVQLGIYVGKGLGFDLIHAVSCVLFALAFGTPMIRSIQRFARRLEVRWEPVHGAAAVPSASAERLKGAARATALLVALVLSGWLAGQPGPIGDGTGSASAANTPAGYLLSAQNSDGGFGTSPGSSSSPVYSGWVALGLAAAGHNPKDVSRSGTSLLAYIRATADSATDPGAIERTILVAGAAGVSASSFGGRDLIGRLESDIRTNGSVDDQVNLTSFAVLALRADGVTPSARTIAWLVRQQDHDGGFNFATAGGSSDVDDTGAALEALAGAGGSARRARRRAVAFIEREQNRDGGFPSEPRADSNAQSTAWAIQGLLAVGVDPRSVHRAGSPSPQQFLSSLIAGDGHIRYSRSSDQTPVWVTGEALMALAGKPLPLAAVAPANRHRQPAVKAAHKVTHSKKVTAKVTPAKHHDRQPRRATRASAPLSALAADAACAAAIALGPVGLV
jgi:prenyltransferase beta subunit